MCHFQKAMIHGMRQFVGGFQDCYVAIVGYESGKMVLSNFSDN